MDKIYANFNLESFKKTAIGALIFGDLALFGYLYFKFANKEVFITSMEIVLKAMPDAKNTLPPDFAEQLYTLMINSLITLLIVAFLYHLLVYTLWFKKNKGFARTYIAAYAWVAGPLCLLSGLSSLGGKPLYGLLFIGLGLIFLFVACGLRVFPEPRGLREKAGR